MSQTQTKPRRNPWTPERRAKQAAAIKIWAPWARSTGPKTRAGKAKSSQNARKHHHQAFKKALRAQARYVAEVKAYLALVQNFAPNELLKKHRRTLLRHGRKVTTQLLMTTIMQKPCILGPPECKS